MDKWSRLPVIIDFVFNQQQPKPGCVYFVQTPFDVAKQSVLGHVLPSLLAWDENERALLNAFMCLSLRYFKLYFQTGTVSASLLLLAL